MPDILLLDADTHMPIHHKLIGNQIILIVPRLRARLRLALA